MPGANGCRSSVRKIVPQLDHGFPDVQIAFGNLPGFVQGSHQFHIRFVRERVGLAEFVLRQTELPATMSHSRLQHPEAFLRCQRCQREEYEEWSSCSNKFTGEIRLNPYWILSAALVGALIAQSSVGQMPRQFSMFPSLGKIFAAGSAAVSCSNFRRQSRLAGASARPPPPAMHRVAARLPRTSAGELFCMALA
jgi:hypothetical protein